MLLLIFNETRIPGVFIIESEKIIDARGFFARTWDKLEFAKKKLNSDIVQCSISYNRQKATLRGIHYQGFPYEETKVVYCLTGKTYNVVVDLRKNSLTFKKWESHELSGDSYKMIYMPKGVAHGFQTLVNDTVLFYQMSQYHMPKHYRGIRWNDPTFNIKWPLKISEISKRDSSFPNFE